MKKLITILVVLFTMSAYSQVDSVFVEDERHNVLKGFTLADVQKDPYIVREAMDSIHYANPFKYNVLILRVRVNGKDEEKAYVSKKVKKYNEGQ